jgi:hypothetical protein
MSSSDVPQESTARKSEPALEYTPGLGGTVTVRGTRLVIALLLVNTTLLGASVMGPQLFPFLRGQWTQWQTRRAAGKAQEQARQAALAVRKQCLAYALPPATVVYEEDPAEAARLLRDGGSAYSRATALAQNAPRGWVPPVRHNSPAFFTEFRSKSSTRSHVASADPLVFLHERTTPGGAKYLVVVQYDLRVDWHTRTETDQSTRQLRVDYHQLKTRRLVALAWKADAAAVTYTVAFDREYRLRLPDAYDRLATQWMTGPGSDRVTPSTDYGNVLRIFAGQPDPADASRFTIPYRLDGRDGVIEGRLKDDGIELRPRDGEWTFDGGEVLRLNAPPPTRPTVFPPQPVTD